MTHELTQEQMQRYLSVLNEVERYRDLTDEEKEHLVRSVIEKPYMDLRCDYALSKVEDKVDYHKYIVITSQTSRLFTKR